MRIVIALLLLTIAAVGQANPRYACGKAHEALTIVYLKNKQEIEALADNLRQTRQGQFPFCWHGCVVKLPKPTFPTSAKSVRLTGSVTIYAVADETGRVFYARPTSGPDVFRNYARQAACAASFTPILYGDHAIKFPWTIKYNFIN